MDERDASEALQAEVREAMARGRPVCLRGGGTKDFYGRPCEAEDRIDVTVNRGIVAYEPTELAITVRAGTPLAEVEALLAGNGQQLPFEPPHFGAAATVGGAVAAGLSGPRRPWGGAVRDAVLGVRIVNGRGQILEFGGRVMKNVAGYDLSRLMAGALGTLGLLLEVSLKVQPVPKGNLTLVHEVDAPRALELMGRWAATAIVVTGAFHDGRCLYVRVCGGEQAQAAAREAIGGEPLAGERPLWRELREQTLPFFAGDAPLWRLSVPPAIPPIAVDGEWLLDWGGAQRWLRSDAPAPEIRAAAAHVGGHAALFRGGDRRGEVFGPLPEGVARLHHNLKAALDPDRLFNPGRMYAGL